MELTNSEYKELLGLNNRLLMLIDLAEEFRNNVKQLSPCLALIKTEQKAIGKKKMPTAADSLNSLKWKYDDFIAIVKKIKGAPKPDALNKAVSELDDLKQKVENEINAINEKLNPVAESVEGFASRLSNTAQALSKKIEKGAQKLGDTISEALNGTVEEIKKRIAGDED